MKKRMNSGVIIVNKWIIGGIIGLCLLNPLSAQAQGDMTDREYEAVYGENKPAEEKKDDMAEK